MPQNDDLPPSLHHQQATVTITVYPGHLVRLTPDQLGVDFGLKDTWQVMHSGSLAVPGGPESLTPYGLPTQQDEGSLGNLSWITQILAGSQERFTLVQVEQGQVTAQAARVIARLWASPPDGSFLPEDEVRQAQLRAIIDDQNAW
ncbi:hypothetical protein [Deinococcus hopiensis]|uniref:Uncharacterized protein n=1 Tax=Deinococcus hopiensis KR-140 TaxID=695939 RepID=A0A1W1VW97_9DEIO|nr:hypothetical protein [Deinococcus hopiensis]SMB97606.1 hypothetical protein SAMN00790413_06082 [Deinococcus hopiensis KR-140]